MTPQELKASILQLAIQGKLVEQRAEEGTGAELLEKILVERGNGEWGTGNGKKLARRREAGAEASKTSASLASPVRPGCPVSPVPPTDAPFDIPESWVWDKLGNCCEMYTGNSISENEKRAKYEGQKKGLDYIGTKDVSFEQTISYDNGVRIPFDAVTEFKIAHKDAILMCIEGGSAGRKIAILDRDVCFGNKLCMFKAETLLNTYLFFYLQSLEFKKAFAGNMTGIIGGVSIKKLKEIIIPLPPLAEQKRIVSKIEELLPYIDRYEKAWSKLEDFNKRFPGDMQKSLLQMAIRGKLVEQRAEEGTGEELLEKILAAKGAKNLTRRRGGRGAGVDKMSGSGPVRPGCPVPLADLSSKNNSALSAPPREEIPDSAKPFDIPESWVWVRLGEVADKIADGEHSTPRRVDHYCGYYLLSARNILDGSLQLQNVDYVDEDEYMRISKRCNPKEGDLLISCSGSIGRVCIAPKGNYVMVRSAAMISDSNNDANFLMYVMWSNLVQSQINELKKKTAQANLFLGAISSILIPLPPLAEQKRIVAKLEELLPLCERLK